MSEAIEAKENVFSVEYFTMQVGGQMGRGSQTFEAPSMLRNHYTVSETIPRR